MHAAVITVPAAFEIDQIDATRKAAEFAGLKHSPLLQEPVAAGLAYGFQDESDNVFWLVYDFGGGTFDAAVIQVRDGIIQVVNHKGDNYLGGQKIDWAIVEKKFIPALTQQYSLTDFRRGNKDWRRAIAQLKAEAENAKIKVCHTKEAKTFWIDDLCQDDSGQQIDFEFQLTPEDIQEIIRPFVKRSSSLSRQAIEEAELAPQDIDKILLVGGTSLTPWLQESLKKEFDIDLEFKVDPMTVVAQGAAIFAGTQKLEQPAAMTVPGVFNVQLEYEPIGSDIEPPVGGRVSHPGEKSLEGYTIELIELKSEWRSGKIALKDNGDFFTTLHAEKGRKCEYRIELCDLRGTVVQAAPDTFEYIVGMVITAPPLTHHIGVAMANNEADFFFEKGNPLPDRKRKVHRAAYFVHRGKADEKLKVPVIEGENKKRADRNSLIGALEVSAKNLTRDIPAGADVEITLSCDESRIIKVEVYVPILDEEYSTELNYQKVTEDFDKLDEDFQKEKKRLSEVRQKANSIDSLKADEALAEIDAQQMVEGAESLLRTCREGGGNIDEFRTQLLHLKNAVDTAEDAVEWPMLVEEAREAKEHTKQIVNEHGRSEDKAMLQKLESESPIQQAIDSGDIDILRRHTDEMHSLKYSIIVRQPSFWVGYLEYLEEQRSSMTDDAQASQLFSQGRRAINNNDLEGLQAAVRQLIGLLPRDMQEKAAGYGGTTISSESK